MITTGAILCGVGLLLFLVGMFLAGSVFSIAGRRLLKMELPFGKEVEGGPAGADATTPCRLLVSLTIESKAVEEEEWFGSTRHKMQFSFPFKAEVIDAGGSQVYATDDAISWQSGTSSSSGKVTTAEGGKKKTQVALDSFTPPASGDFRVKARIDEDEEFGASHGPATLFLLDRTETAPNFMNLIRGMIFTVLGPLLIVAGVIVLIIGLLT